MARSDRSVVANPSSLQDLEERLRAEILEGRRYIERVEIDLRGEMQVLGRDLRQFKVTVEEASGSIQAAASGLQQIPASLQKMTAAVRNDLQKGLRVALTDFADRTRSAIEAAVSQVREVSRTVEAEQRELLEPAFQTFGQAILQLEHQSGDLNQRLLDTFDRLRTELDQHAGEEVAALERVNDTGQALAATMERANEIALSLERTFSHYQQSSLDRTRMRELVEGDVLLETARKELHGQCWSRAEQVFAEAEKRLPRDDVRPALGRATARAGAGELESARSILEQILQGDPANRDALDMLVRLYLAEGMSDRAEVLLERYQQQGGDDRQDSWFLKLLGVTYYARDRVAEGLANLRKARVSDRFGDSELEAVLLRLGEIEGDEPREPEAPEVLPWAGV